MTMIQTIGSTNSAQAQRFCGRHACHGGASPAAAASAAAMSAAVAVAAPGDTCTAISGSAAMRATPASVSHHAMRGPAMRSAPSRTATTITRRTTVACGRSSTKRSSGCTGSGNNCAPVPMPRVNSGNWLAMVPSATASMVTAALSPTRSDFGASR